MPSPRFSALDALLEQHVHDGLDVGLAPGVGLVGLPDHINGGVEYDGHGGAQDYGLLFRVVDQLQDVADGDADFPDQMLLQIHDLGPRRHSVAFLGCGVECARSWWAGQ